MPKTIGPLAAALDVPFALRLARAGKVPNPLSAHKAKDNDQVKRLWKLLEAERQGPARTPAPIERPGAVIRRCRSATRTTPAASPRLSAKELDTSTRAVARKLGVELVDMESTTCCGAGDIHEAKPDYYLHLNARILGQAEALGCDTLLTICNVCTLNLRQANKQLREHAGRARARQREPRAGRRARLRRRRRGAAPAVGGLRGRRLRALQGDRRASLTGLKVAPFYGCQILRPSKLLGFEDPDSPSSLERLIEACGAEAIDYPGEDQVLRLPDHPGA